MKEEDSVEDRGVTKPEAQTEQKTADTDTVTSADDTLQTAERTAEPKNKHTSKKNALTTVLFKLMNRLFAVIVTYIKAIKEEYKQLKMEKLVTGLITGITLSEFFRKLWLFFFVGFLFSVGQIGISYLMRDELLKKGRLERRLRNIAYKSLERSSQLREQTLGSNIEKMLSDSTLQVSNEAPFQLVIDTDEEE